MDMLLTDEERRKFVTWLRQDAMSNRAIAEQMVKLPGAAMALLVRRKNAEATAEEIVAKILESIESVTIK